MKSVLKYALLVVIVFSCMAAFSLVLGELIGYDTVGVKGLVAGLGIYILNKRKSIFKKLDEIFESLKTRKREENKKANDEPVFQENNNEKEDYSKYFSSSMAREWISPYFEKVMSRYCKEGALSSKIRLFFYTDDRSFSVVDMKDSPLVIASKVIKEILRLLTPPSSMTEQQSRVSLNSLCNNVIESGKLTEKKSRIDWGLIGFLSLLAILLVYIIWDMGEDAKGPVASESKQTPSVEQIISSNSSMNYKHRLLYDVLRKDNYDLGSYEFFCLNLWDEYKRRNLYENLIDNGVTLGTYKEFSDCLGFPLPESFKGDSYSLPIKTIELRGEEYKILISRSPDFMYKYPESKYQQIQVKTNVSESSVPDVGRINLDKYFPAPKPLPKKAEEKEYVLRVKMKEMRVPESKMKKWGIARYAEAYPDAKILMKDKFTGETYWVDIDSYEVAISDDLIPILRSKVKSSSNQAVSVKPNDRTQNGSRSGYKEVSYNTGDMPYISHFGWGVHDEESLSKLTIINNSSKDAVVLLENSRSKVIRNVFVKNGARYVMDKIPEGMYSVKIMYGNSWNKDKDNGPSFPKGGFMRNVAFEKTEESDMFDYSFKRDDEGVSYPSYSVTLHKVQNGNLESEEISASEFFY